YSRYLVKILNIITDINASGKSNLFKARMLLSGTADGGVIHSLANEGCLYTTFWAGTEKLSRQMINGEVAIQGKSKQHVDRLRLGFAVDLFGHSRSFGKPEASQTDLLIDPEINRDTI
ncbi:ATP-binding protein, partial [Francisella tularensis subsp. holarctica]|nr:ATP-binding protein [Francisella tularensis subsp. holarctica]